MFKKINLFLIILILSMSSSISVLSETNACDEKVIYLTFDDGISSHMTEEIIDILDSENVKGTFFLIGNTITHNPKCMKKLIDSHHGIGLHTYSHDKNKIYRSKEYFIEEMDKCNEALFQMTGTKSNIIRFPFGTNNNSFKLNKEWVDYIHSNNYKIYDWNVDTSDGCYPNKTPYKIYRDSISNKDYIILLMHATDLNKNSAVALTDVIKYYKKQGYTFKTIDNTTEEMYKLKNLSISNFFEF